jgi:uncharacterized repeat protein (TIGR01451 family)
MPKLIYFILFTALTPSIIAQSADLSVFKNSTPNPVTAGASLTYTITVSNEGPDDAANTQLSDPLPPGTTFQSVVIPAGWACGTVPPVGTNGTLTCTIATFPPGSADFTLNVLVDSGVPDGTVLANIATITTTTSDPNTNNNSAEADTTVSSPVPTLSITKSGSPDPVVAGTNLSYTITASNNGNSPLDTATVSDTLPAGTTFVSLASPGGWSCTTPAAGAAGSISCSITPMPDSTAAVFTLVVLVGSNHAAGALPNQATFFSTQGGRDTTLSGSTSTQVQISSDLNVTKGDAPDPVTAGSNIVYTIGVLNNGPSDAASVTLSDTLPTGTTFVSLASPGGWSCTTPAVGAAGSISCAGSLVAGASATFTLAVMTSITLPNGTLSNTASASSASDPNNANNSATATTAVQFNPNTTTTVNAPTVTFPANGVVTVTVSAAGVAPTGNVSLIVDGGAPLTQALSPATATSSTATFTLISPPIGPHTLQANYAAQNGFNASSGNGSLVVISGLPALDGGALLLLAAVLAIVAIRSRGL